MAGRDDTSKLSPPGGARPEGSGVFIPEGERKTIVALSERHGVPGVDLDGLRLDLADLDAVPLEIARRHVVLPLLVQGESLFLAMAAPGDTRAIEEVEFVSGRKVHPFVAEADKLSATLEAVYAAREAGERVRVGTRALRSMPVPAAPSGPRPAPAVIKPSAPAHETGSLSLSLPAGPPHLAPRRGPPPPPPRGAGAGPRVPLPGPPPLPQELSGRDASPPLFAPVRAPAPSVAPASPERASVVSRLPSVAPTGKMVWVVDADGASREALREALTELGHQTVTLDGTAALLAQRDNAHLPHLLVIDPSDPTDPDDRLGRAFGLWSQLLEDPRWAEVPAVMLTARWQGWRAADDLGESLGVRALLPKPLSLVDAVSRIESALDGNDPRHPSDPMPPGVKAALQASTEAYQRGDPDGAVHALESALASPANAGGAHHLRYQLGLLFGKRGEVFRAIAALEAAVEADEAFFPAFKNLAVLYERAGFRRKALEAWERAHFVAADAVTRGQIQDRILALLQPE